MPRRKLPSPEDAEQKLRSTRERLQRLRDSGAARQQVRTAEVDWFGAEETLTLARTAEDRRLKSSYASVLPAEIQLIRVGRWSFIGWPGELFVEYSLAVKREFPDAFVISLRAPAQFGH
ncbi:MAG: hypothetical protein ACE15E_02915 [Acidobacteriota bacterium]